MFWGLRASCGPETTKFPNSLLRRDRLHEVPDRQTEQAQTDNHCEEDLPAMGENAAPERPELAARELRVGALRVERVLNPVERECPALEDDLRVRSSDDAFI